jgi:hypothetical protein
MVEVTGVASDPSYECEDDDIFGGEGMHEYDFGANIEMNL